MKALDFKAQTKNFFSGILITVMICSIVSCSNKAIFTTSTVVPAAQGYVKIKRDKNKNYVINMQITNLAGVERLQPERKTYVVWMQTEDNLTKNIGRVKSSNKLKVNFQTVSSYKPKKVFITSEDNENAQYPGDMVVLTSENITK